jgi:multiple sugar transport system substrate-binding protein
VIPVTESDLGTRATAAFAAGDLPDVIYHTLQYALPWAEAGILDADAATEVIETSARTPSPPARWRWRRWTRAMPRCRWTAGRR